MSRLIISNGKIARSRSSSCEIVNQKKSLSIFLVPIRADEII